MAKPTRADVLALGLPAPAVVQIKQAIERFDAATGLVYLSAHGLSLDDVVELRIVTHTTPGGTAGALPTGLAEGVTYYARPATAGAFRLAAAPSPASAIASFGSAAVGRAHVWLDPGAALDTAIDRAWTAILARCTAHGGDVEAQVITDAAAALASAFYVAHVAAGDPAKAASYDGISALFATVYQPLLDTYLRGTPVRGAADATPTVSEGSPRFRVLGAPVSSPTSWGTTSAEVV
ncbi:MAG: hypothetical protein KBF21_15470 [Thermoanaerobaculia bacterium]|nr:hypothetical protein [Thermoanaerobaculia bacterium]